MNTPLRVLIHGASGRMGQALLRLAAEAPDAWRIVAAVTGRSPAQRVVDGVPFFAAAELAGVPEFDVAIDFSLPAGFDPMLALCVARGRPLVSGTTGLEPAQRQALAAAGERIPLLWASNFSVGVAVLDELVERAARALPGWDCDIVGEHLVQFAGQGERVELVHRATSRDIFARGALHAATVLAQRPPGLHTMRGLLFGAD